MKFEPEVIGGLRVAAEVHNTPEALEARITLHREPDEDIRLLGLMVADVKLQEDMLKNLAFKNEADYRGNLLVCRGAAERVKARCTRLLGDADESSQLGRKKAGTANGKPKSRKPTPEAK